MQQELWTSVGIALLVAVIAGFGERVGAATLASIAGR
jgi:hypothetical protein